jgi:hypothetical protein
MTRTLSPSSLPELLARLAAIDRDLAALNRVYNLLCQPRKEPRRRRVVSRQRAPLVMPELVDVRDMVGVAPLWAFLEDVERDTALRKKAKASEAVERQPMKPLPMHPAPMPIKPPRVSPLERARRLGIGYEV